MSEGGLIREGDGRGDRQLGGGRPVYGNYSLGILEKYITVLALFSIFRFFFSRVRHENGRGLSIIRALPVLFLGDVPRCYQL